MLDVGSAGSAMTRPRKARRAMCPRNTSPAGAWLPKAEGNRPAAVGGQASGGCDALVLREHMQHAPTQE